MGKFKLDEQKLNSLKTYKDKGLRTVIGCVWALSIFTIWALSTVENGAKAEMNNSGWTIESEFPFEIKSTNSFCEWAIKQELRNIIWGEQDELWFWYLMLQWRCDYEIEWVKRAVEQRKATEYAINYWEWGRYPGKLNADWTSQEMPEVKWTDSHQRFKELCQAYWLDPSKIWELENKYNLREGVLLAILIAETSWWHNWNYVDEGCYNLWNVWNNDRHDRVCFEWKRESIEQVAMTLNNRYLWNVLTLGCLSNAWSCVRYFDSWKRYATSNGNWERNMLNVLNTIYGDELGEINASKFSVRRDFISLQ